MSRDPPEHDQRMMVPGAILSVLFSIGSSRDCHDLSDSDEGGFGMRVSRHRLAAIALGHMHGYVPRRTARAPTAFTP